MIYTSIKTNFSKSDDVYEIKDSIIEYNGETININDINKVNFIKRFDGFIFIKLNTSSKCIAVSSHSAQGFGKTVQNKKSELLKWLLLLTEKIPNDTKYGTGSSAWKITGIFCIVLSILVLIALIAVLITGGEVPHSVRWGKIASIPVLLFLGIKMVKNGGMKILNKSSFQAYLNAV